MTIHPWTPTNDDHNSYAMRPRITAQSGGTSRAILTLILQKRSRCSWVRRSFLPSGSIWTMPAFQSSSEVNLNLHPVCCPISMIISSSFWTQIHRSPCLLGPWNGSKTRMVDKLHWLLAAMPALREVIRSQHLIESCNNFNVHYLGRLIVLETDKILNASGPKYATWGRKVLTDR